VLAVLAAYNIVAFPLALAALAVLAVRSPERAAFGGGALIPTGLWFLDELRGAVERCAEFDRVSRPNGGCAIYGVNEQAIAVGFYVAVGVGLTAYAAIRRRRSGASAGPSVVMPERR
jgi:predicted NBD/HSP70 family sugar kinase